MGISFLHNFFLKWWPFNWVNIEGVATPLGKASLSMPAATEFCAGARPPVLSHEFYTQNLCCLLEYPSEGIGLWIQGHKLGYSAAVQHHWDEVWKCLQAACIFSVFSTSHGKFMAKPFEAKFFWGYAIAIINDHAPGQNKWLKSWPLARIQVLNIGRQVFTHTND